MNHTPLTSTSLKSVGYDAERHVLEVVFVNGGIYAYSGVPESVYQDLIDVAAAGGSVGKFFAANIRPKYPFERQ